MKKLLLLLLLSPGLIACSEKESEFDSSNSKFYKHKDEILIGCLYQLMSEIRADHSVPGAYLNRNQIHACLDANFPYPGDIEEGLSYTLEEEIDNNQYKLKVCQEVDGSMGSYWCKIIVHNPDNEGKEFDINNVFVYQ